MAGFSPSPLNEITPNPPPRHGNQRGSHSAPWSKKTARLLELYENDCQVRYGARTVEGYLQHVRVLLAWLVEKRLELVNVRSDDLLAYQTALVSARKQDGTPYSIEHQRGRIVAVKSLFGFLYRRSYLLSDPSASLELPRSEKRLPRTVLTQDEAQRILECCRGQAPEVLRDRALLETLYATGIRAGELAGLTPYDVDTRERTLRVVLGKGRKDRNVPLTRAACRAIERYLVNGRPRLLANARAPYLFLGTKGGKLLRAVLSRIVKRWTRTAGVKKRVTCHTFRHSVATHLLQRRADIRHIQALLGHESLSTTERYTRVEIRDLHEVMRRAHPRGR